jgi:hypothetical protein
MSRRRPARTLGACERLTWILVVGVFRGDFAPRADGARAYRFYAETANITGP